MKDRDEEVPPRLEIADEDCQESQRTDRSLLGKGETVVSRLTLASMLTALVVLAAPDVSIGSQAPVRGPVKSGAPKSETPARVVARSKLAEAPPMFETSDTAE